MTKVSRPKNNNSTLLKIFCSPQKGRWTKNLSFFTSILLDVSSSVMSHGKRADAISFFFVLFLNIFNILRFLYITRVIIYFLVCVINAKVVFFFVVISKVFFSLIICYCTFGVGGIIFVVVVCIILYILWLDTFLRLFGYYYNYYFILREWLCDIDKNLRQEKKKYI